MAEETEIKSKRKMFIKTALKVLLLTTITLILMIFFAVIAVIITDSGEIGILAMVFGFFLGIILLIFSYPRFFKDYAKHWEQKQKEIEDDKKKIEEIENAKSCETY